MINILNEKIYNNHKHYFFFWRNLHVFGICYLIDSCFSVNAHREPMEGFIDQFSGFTYGMIGVSIYNHQNVKEKMNYLKKEAADNFNRRRK